MPAPGRPIELLGRHQDLESLLGLCHATLGARKGGTTVFLAGEDANGRSSLLHALASKLEATKPRPIVLVGGFVDGDYVPRNEGPSAARVVAAALTQLGSAGERVAGLLSDLSVPYAGLVRHAISVSKVPIELLGQALSPEPADLSELAPRVLRGLCAQGPVVCVVEDADKASEGGLWADLILGFAGRVARDLPLVLVLAVEGPARLGSHHDDEPDSLNVARQLTEAGIAHWHALSPVSFDVLDGWIGGAAPDVLNTLLEITDGRSAWTAQLWAEWCRRGVVEDLTSGQWRFSAGRERALDEVDDLLRERIKALIGTSDLDALARARAVLVCAALEGQRFTAAAVAAALGRDVDELIDFLDGALVLDADNVDGLVLEAGWVTVTDERGRRQHAAYRFARELDWLTLRHHGYDAGPRRRKHAAGLADALASLYGGQANRAAHTLARLYLAAGDRARSAHHRRVADLGINRDVILQRARNVLEAPDPQDAAERRRACVLLIDAAWELFQPGPFADGVVFAQAAYRLAALRAHQAEALHLTAYHHGRLGANEQARAEYGQALALRRELHDRRGEASTRQERARIDLAQGSYARARSELRQVLALRHELGDAGSAALVRDLLARIDIEQGAYERAREELMRVLAIWRQRRDRWGEAVTWNELAHIDVEQGSYEEARTKATRALELRRSIGHRHGEAISRHLLARIAVEVGDHDAARRELTEVLALRRKLGDRHGEVDSILLLARIDVEQGRRDDARSNLAQVGALCEELGDLHNDVRARHLLARIAFEDGSHEQARRALLDVVESYRELGDRHGQARARHVLACIARDEGDDEAARTLAVEVLESCSRLGDRAGAAQASEMLRRMPEAGSDSQPPGP